MKTFFITLLALGLFSFSVQAEEKWETELETYGQQIQDYGNLRLYANTLGYSSLLVGTCSASALIVAATAIADTYPILNIVSESVANLTNDEYETLDAEAFLSLETLADTGRGAVGGGVVALAESFEYVFLWLSGREDQSYSGLKEVYKSTVMVSESLFSQQGKCLMSFTKLLITLNEMTYRQESLGPVYQTDDEVTMP